MFVLARGSVDVRGPRLADRAGQPRMRESISPRISSGLTERSISAEKEGASQAAAKAADLIVGAPGEHLPKGVAHELRGPRVIPHARRTRPCYEPRSRPRVASRSSWSSIQTVWQESILGWVTQARSPRSTLSRAAEYRSVYPPKRPNAAASCSPTGCSRPWRPCSSSTTRSSQDLSV
jgi:hypothetical protein